MNLNLSLRINHEYTIGISTQWRFFGKYHGRPISVEGGSVTCFYYGWFYYERPENSTDQLLLCIKEDRLRDFLDWHSCNNIDEYLLKEKHWITPKELKKVRKYQKKLEKILEYRKDFGLKV